MTLKVIRKRLSAEEVEECDMCVLEIIAMFEKRIKGQNMGMAIYAMKRLVHGFEVAFGVKLDMAKITASDEREEEVVKGVAG